MTVLGVVLGVVGALAVAVPAVAAGETCNGLPATIVGTGGADTIVGTAGNDVIVGLGGNDTISGGLGNDTICAGGGNDTVYGDAETFVGAALLGNDTIFGEGGDDLLIGDYRTVDLPAGAALAGGDDSIDGGGGADVLAGDVLDVTLTVIGTGIAFGRDVLNGGDGDGVDVLYGELRNFTITAAGILAVEGGNDTIGGGGGADTLFGDFQNVVTAGVITGTGLRDTIAAGADVIYGDAATGQDKLLPVGNLGFADTIDGGAGSDDADGGPGTDSCVNVEHPTSC